MKAKKKEYRIEGRPQTIYRVVKSPENPYVMVDRRPIDNPALSFKAKGILTYLMSRPDGWEVSVSDLVNHATDGDDSIRSGLKELKDANHMKYTKMREKGRITGWLIEVYEIPHADFQDVEKPDVEKPDVEKPDVEKPTQVLKNLSKTELKNKESSSKAETAAASFLSPLFEVYEQEFGRLTPFSKKEFVKAIETYSADWVTDAIREAVIYNKRNFQYCVVILERWMREGRTGKQKEPSKLKRTFDAIDSVLK